MDILLINAPVKVRSPHSRLTPPPGLSYIASVLLENGYETSAIDFNLGGFRLTRLKLILKDKGIKILGVSTSTETYPNALKIAEIAKQLKPDIKVVFGGAHATVMHREVAAEKDVDVVVRGEGEYSMLELADHFIKHKGKISQIKGISYYEGGAVRTTVERSFIENPDELPFPARGLFSIPLYTKPWAIVTSRGKCPYTCHFCAVNNIWKGRRRAREPEKIALEIMQILERENARELAFLDDTFSFNRKDTLKLCGILKNLRQRFNFSWECSTRVDLIDEELLRVMHESGCCDIQYGVEAGSQKILDSIGKRIKVEQVRNAVKSTLDNNIGATCSFMFPHPEDTEETIAEQIDLMNELADMGAEEVMSFTTPSPGTYYYEHADRIGIKILANSWDEYDGKHLIIATKYLNEKKLNGLLDKLIQEVNLKREF